MNVLVLEGGTTTSRAWVSADGQVTAATPQPGGARDRDPAAFLAALNAAAEEVLAQANVDCDLAVACGMLGSEWGVVEVPHVWAPAGASELAHGVVTQSSLRVAGLPVLIIPGVRTREDMCRGEETAALGLSPRRLIFPGSHGKLVEKDASGRIVEIATAAAGELVRAVAECTLAGAAAAPVTARALDYSALRAGAMDARERGLGHATFQLRAHRVLGHPDEDALAYLIGAVAADNLRCYGPGDLAVAVSSEIDRGWAAAYRAAVPAGRVRVVDASMGTVSGALRVVRSYFAQAAAGSAAAPVKTPEEHPL